MGTRGQVSETVSTGILLTLSGGFQGTYTYYRRENVFADAQTGNIVLMGSHLAAREQNLAARYLALVLALAGGVYMVEHVKRLHRQDRKFHWRQLTVAIEVILFLVVGLLPQDMNMAANIIVSFVCALQVNALRKIKGSPYATIIHIGNLRSVMENLYWYRHTGKKNHWDKYIRYHGVIGIFTVGAVMGSIFTAYFREHIIWASYRPLLASFLIMFVKEDIEDGRRQKLPCKEMETYGK